MKKIVIIITFGFLLGCSSKIKSILEYQKKGNEFVLRKITKFDKNGNKVLSKRVGNIRSNRIITTDYKNNRKIYEKSCDYFKSDNICVIRSFSKYEFDKKTRIEKQTLFEPDSAIRLIREVKSLKNTEIRTVYTWEFNPTKTPKVEDALILTDTTYFDRKGRKVKTTHHNSRIKESWIEIFKYYKNEYSKQTIGTARDAVLRFKITDFQKMAEKKKLDYRFFNSENIKYKIEEY